MAKILVVDDSSTVRDEVAGFLKSHGLDVATAVDGRDGLNKLKGDSAIRLVVSDVNMPNMDGLTMAEKIRGELKNTAVNLIMLTTESNPSMKERGKSAGIKGLDRQAVQRCGGARNVQEARRPEASAAERGPADRRPCPGFRALRRARRSAGGRGQWCIVPGGIVAIAPPGAVLSRVGSSMPKIIATCATTRKSATNEA